MVLALQSNSNSWAVPKSQEKVKPVRGGSRVGWGEEMCEGQKVQTSIYKVNEPWRGEVHHGTTVNSTVLHIQELLRE